MLDVILQIISVIGTILLILLILVIVLLLLILFFPITYKFWGIKQEEMVLKAKVNWLFGLFRVRYAYPEPGKLTVKLLWFTLYETLLPGGEKTNDGQTDVNAKSADTGDKKNTAVSEPVAIEENTTDAKSVAEQKNVSEEPSEAVELKGFSSQEGDIPGDADGDTDEPDKDSFFEKILKKIEQIKYTIVGLCDKIKEIWENINYYVELFQEESSKALFRHVFLRVGSILKSIRPRHLKADIFFGTGSPDTTGYAYAVYGMLSAILGPKFIVTPDFEQAILKGELQFSGHITIWVLLINGLKLLFDKKLHHFIRKVKAGLPKKTADDKQSNHNQE